MDDEGKRDSSGSGTFDDEDLDPRIQIELEKLNKAAEAINKLELELDEARNGFHTALTDSTQKLDELSKKLGSCIERARPYYEARIKAKEAQDETQKAALRYEKANSMQGAAKEMVCLAEEAFLNKKDEPFNPAWQEMLNHATMKENEAEKELIESEVEHQLKAEVYSEAEHLVKELQRQLKRAINKSRLSCRRSMMQLSSLANQHHIELLPYFEMKAELCHYLEEQKQTVSMLENDIKLAKVIYKESLVSLEAISDEIHLKRKNSQCNKNLGPREEGVGAELPSQPELSSETGSEISKPLLDNSMDECAKENTEMNNDIKDDLDKNDSGVESITSDSKGSESQQEDSTVVRRERSKVSPSNQRNSYLLAMKGSCEDYEIPSDNVGNTAESKCVDQKLTEAKSDTDSQALLEDIGGVRLKDDDTEFKELPKTYVTSPQIVVTAKSPDVDEYFSPFIETDNQKSNTDLSVDSVSQSVLSQSDSGIEVASSGAQANFKTLEDLTAECGFAKVNRASFSNGAGDKNMLHPNSSTDNLQEWSDTDSVGSVEMLDDDQIEQLAVDMDQIQFEIEETLDKEKEELADLGQKYMSLPTRLSGHLSHLNLDLILKPILNKEHEGSEGSLKVGDDVIQVQEVHL